MKTWHCKCNRVYVCRVYHADDISVVHICVYITYLLYIYMCIWHICCIYMCVDNISVVYICVYITYLLCIYTDMCHMCHVYVSCIWRISCAYICVYNTSVVHIVYTDMCHMCHVYDVSLVHIYVYITYLLCIYMCIWRISCTYICVYNTSVVHIYRYVPYVSCIWRISCTYICVYNTSVVHITYTDMCHMCHVLSHMYLSVSHPSHIWYLLYVWFLLRGTDMYNRCDVCDGWDTDKYTVCDGWQISHVAWHRYVHRYMWWERHRYMWWERHRYMWWERHRYMWCARHRYVPPVDIKPIMFRPTHKLYPLSTCALLLDMIARYFGP